MNKTILILTDGMSDDPLPELDGKTPIEHAQTPNMDAIAAAGASGVFKSLLYEDIPTSSDVANMSVMGYDTKQFYCGRGPLEAMSQGIELGPDDIAFRCNLVQSDGEKLLDYSGGHIGNEDAAQLMADLAAEFNCDDYTFHTGVSYRNLLILHGPQFGDKVTFNKPDDHQDDPIELNRIDATDDSAENKRTADLANDLIARCSAALAAHPINLNRKEPANMIWLQSSGRRPALMPFSEKYGVHGAVISAVDVIFGLAVCVGMDVIKVPGATGFIDTNYEGKADAAVAALADHDFVYLHVEAADECSHMGDLKLKLQAIEDIDRRLVGRVREQLEGQDVTYAVLPDHPVPVKLRKHTRDPVPVTIAGAHITPDAIETYGERSAQNGGLGYFEGDKLMRLILNV
jgi:2,3-bisphosphoglycerate-independent phosphoglycerate mutase